MSARKNLLPLLWLILLSISSCQEPLYTDSLDTKRLYMISLMNSVRSQQSTGLAALYMDVALNGIAQAHSVDMVNRNFFSHVNPDGLSPQQRATAAGFRYSVG